MGLRLLHVSDIHFGGYGEAWDDDEDQRREAIAEVRRYVHSAGPVDAILVGGDVAYSGAPHEYEAAQDWLHDLAKDAECNPSRIWTVPGNHDVDHAKLDASIIGQEFRRALRECDANRIDLELRNRLSLEPNAAGLLAPLENYNKFALQWECGITADSPMWRDSSLAVDGVPICLTGICSALVSDLDDSKHTDDKKLVIGTRQCQIPTHTSHVSIVMCHHPPEWLRDWEAAEPYLKNRAHLILFGHEHRYGSRKEANGPVYISAGAIGPPHVGPFADEPYAPTFNIIELSIREAQLDVAVHPRRWSATTAKFEALDAEHFAVQIAGTIRPYEAPVNTADGAPDTNDNFVSDSLQSSPLAPDTTSRTESADDEGRTRSPTQLRELGLKFVQQSRTSRISLLGRLGVLEDDDLTLPEPLFISETLTRIREADLIDKLVEELAHDK